MRDPKPSNRDRRATLAPARPRPFRGADAHGGPGAEGSNPPPPSMTDREPRGYHPPALRRAIRLRGLREVGLLGSLTLVMAATASYVWNDSVSPGRIGPAPPPSMPMPDVLDASSDRLTTFDVPSPSARHVFLANPSIDAAGLSPVPIARDEADPPIEPDDPESPIAGSGLPTLIAGPDRGADSTLALLGGNAQRLRHPPQKMVDGPPASPRSDPTSAGRGEIGPNLLVSDASGRALVSQFYARGPDGPVVLLPDGSLGWPDGEIATDRPFRPATIEQLKDRLLGGPFDTFFAVERAPYLVLSNGSPEFATDAADLLRDLFEALTGFLDASGLDVDRPTFPLVAIIFADEDEFRRHRPVEPEVRAYYETVSNRIILYERSEQDLRAPELVAVRQPQMVAHEGVHQILQNIGVQRRLSNWPPWLVEGLAEFFATGVSSGPTAGRPRGHWGELDRKNFGKINPFHMATLIDLRSPAAFDLPLRADGLTPRAIRPGPGPPEPWVTRLVLRPELTATDYALAWSLTNYLARTFPEAFTAYLRELSARPPLAPRTPEQQLDDFVSHFEIEPKQLARRIDRHLAVARYEQVPFYAVCFEQDMGPAPPRRGVYVTQSPTMIAQWLRSQTRPDGGLALWWASPYPSRNLARQAAESWFLGPFH